MSEAAAARIDVRGPRFAAAVTAVLLLAATFLGLTGLSTARSFGWFAYQPLAAASFPADGASWALPSAAPAERLLDPAFLLLALIAALFLWGVLSPRTAPWGVIFRRWIQPHLRPATEFEDARPPRFAQGVGLVVTATGLVLHLVGVPWALPIAAAVAFVAAALNAVFGLCLGCRIYLLLQRAGLVGRRPAV
ncbi:DUF4395 domain-containing protein [Microbacterium caowuchunii]|uniref:DUF4395 domain-containing protein n=1 Tax=Microbacterium caowuchunii TaxID=2614638 RepID=A0A5N0T762_9MICO|nr:DUF4395 domain-containing protein [Microbacterium caowuchunii]KAA9129967.1 DUF4395 domain-containing protein [Microbacterium caowuchunii]